LSGRGWRWPPGWRRPAAPRWTEAAACSTNGGTITFDATGFDATGFDATGFDATGFDATGFDATGFDATGFTVLDDEGAAVLAARLP
jgi:hypothetical protein